MGFDRLIACDKDDHAGNLYHKHRYVSLTSNECILISLSPSGFSLPPPRRPALRPSSRSSPSPVFPRVFLPFSVMVRAPFLSQWYLNELPEVWVGVQGHLFDIAGRPRHQWHTEVFREALRAAGSLPELTGLLKDTADARRTWKHVCHL